MQDACEPSALQLLFIELRVGLARSAIQAALLLNGGAAVALLLFLANVVASPGESVLPVDLVLLKWAFAVFGLGLFIAAITFVNAYVAQGAIASRRLRVRQCDAAAWLEPDRRLPPSLPRRLALVVAAI